MKNNGIWNDCLNKGDNEDELLAIQRFMSGETDLEKMRGYPIYKLRLTHGDRLLFLDMGALHHRVLVRLKRLTRHHYNRQPYTKDEQYLHQFLERIQAGLSQLIEDDAQFSLDAEPDAQSTLPPLCYYNRRLIVLDTDQQQGLNNMRTPALIDGSAGSGKTCVSFMWMQKVAAEMPLDETKAILYLAPEQHLVDRMQQFWTEGALNHQPHVNVQFLTYDQLIMQYDSRCELGNRVGYSHFLTWLLAYIQTQQPLVKLKRMQPAEFAILMREPERIYEGFREISAYMRQQGAFRSIQPERYLAQNNGRGLFSGDEKKVILKAYLAYQQSLNPQSKLGQPALPQFWDPTFYDLPVQSQYHAIMVDEAQQLAPIQWWSLYDLADDAKRIIFAGDDDHQRSHDRQSLKPLKSLEI